VHCCKILKLRTDYCSAIVPIYFYATVFPPLKCQKPWSSQLFNVVDIELIPVQILMRCLFLFTHGRDHFESLGLSGNNCCRWFDMFTESRYRNQRLISNLRYGCAYL